MAALGDGVGVEGVGVLCGGTVGVQADGSDLTTEHRGEAGGHCSGQGTSVVGGSGGPGIAGDGSPGAATGGTGVWGSGHQSAGEALLNDGDQLAASVYAFGVERIDRLKAEALGEVEDAGDGGVERLHPADLRGGFAILGQQSADQLQDRGDLFGLILHRRVVLEQRLQAILEVAQGLVVDDGAFVEVLGFLLGEAEAILSEVEELLFAQGALVFFFFFLSPRHDSGGCGGCAGLGRTGHASIDRAADVHCIEAHIKPGVETNVAAADQAHRSGGGVDGLDLVGIKRAGDIEVAARSRRGKSPLQVLADVGQLMGEQLSALGGLRVVGTLVEVDVGADREGVGVDGLRCLDGCGVGVDAHAGEVDATQRRPHLLRDR